MTTKVEKMLSIHFSLIQQKEANLNAEEWWLEERASVIKLASELIHALRAVDDFIEKWGDHVP